MSHDDLKNYFAYVKNTLGVNQLYIDKGDNNADNNADNNVALSPKWLIFVEAYKSYTKEEAELLTKMLEAVHLAPNDYQIRELELSQLEELKINRGALSLDGLKIDDVTNSSTNGFLFLNDPQKNFSSVKDLAGFAATYSPRTLIRTPQLKRAAWDQMKQIFKV